MKKIIAINSEKAADFKLKKIYDKIFAFSRKGILANEVNINPFLMDKERDMRKGVSLIVKPKEEVLEKIKEKIEELKKAEPGQYYYDLNDLHFTVYSIQRVSPDFVFNEDNISKFKKIFKKYFQDKNKFKIRINGITANKSAVMLQGFVGGKHLKIRKGLKKVLEKSELPYNNKFMSTIAHSCISRYKEKLKKPAQFVQNIEKNRDVDLGEFEVDKILFVHHDYFNSKDKTEVIAEYKLA
ncbi:hypothetical protein ACFL2K_04170 [Candidatus Margulisiibacteriota bacterium]